MIFNFTTLFVFNCLPLALPTSIEPGWKGLPGTNALAYFLYTSVAKKFNNIDGRPIKKDEEVLIDYDYSDTPAFRSYFPWYFQGKEQ
jgi:hypothetical protein